MNLDKIFNYSKTIFWIGLVLVIYIFVILVDENTKNYKLRQQAAQLQAQNAQLQTQIQDLKYKITYYSSDNYRELAARQQLGLQAPGESVIIVPKKNGSTANTADNTSAQNSIKAPPKSNFGQWLEFLFQS